MAHVAQRADLTYVIGEMISELNAGHAYVGGGDMARPPRIPQGLLGAQLRKDPKTGYVQIVKILKGARWDSSLRSPPVSGRNPADLGRLTRPRQTTQPSRRERAYRLSAPSPALCSQLQLRGRLLRLAPSPMQRCKSVANCASAISSKVPCAKPVIASAA